MSSGSPQQTPGLSGGPHSPAGPSENSPRPGASFQTTEDRPCSLGTSPRTAAHCAREETGPCGRGAGPPPRSEGRGRGNGRESSMQKITGRKRFFVPSQSGRWEARDWLLTGAWPGPVQGQSSEPSRLQGARWPLQSSGRGLSQEALTAQLVPATSALGLPFLICPRSVTPVN